MTEHETDHWDDECDPLISSPETEGQQLRERMKHTRGRASPSGHKYPMPFLVISLSTQYEREPLYFHISNVSHWRGLIATHCTNAVPPAAYVSLRDHSLTLRVQVTLFAQYHFNAGQLFRSLGHFQQFRRCLIKPAAIHTQRCSQNLVKPAPPL